MVNKISYKLTLINTNFKCYSIVDKNLITDLWFPRVKIPLKPITGFIKENIKEPGVEIIKIAKIFINIQGYRRNILACIVFILLNLIIIGLLWIKKVNIIIKPVINTLIINSYSLTVLIKEILILLKIKKLIITFFIIFIKGVKQCQKPLIIFKVLLMDIIKVLRHKIIKIPAEIRKLLPA